jgi:hypothetical protein
MVFGAATALSCGIGAGSGPKAREHASYNPLFRLGARCLPKPGCMRKEILLVRLVAAVSGTAAMPGNCGTASRNVGIVAMW